MAEWRSAGAFDFAKSATVAMAFSARDASIPRASSFDLSSLIMGLEGKYRGQDSNLHKLAHLILSQARLPIPPPRRWEECGVDFWIRQVWKFWRWGGERPE